VEFFLFVDALLILLRHHIIIIKFSSNISTWQPSCCNHFEMEWSIHIVPNSCFVYDTTFQNGRKWSSVWANGTEPFHPNRLLVFRSFSSFSFREGREGPAAKI